MLINNALYYKTIENVALLIDICFLYAMDKTPREAGKLLCVNCSACSGQTTMITKEGATQ